MEIELNELKQHLIQKSQSKIELASKSEGKDL